MSKNELDELIDLGNYISRLKDEMEDNEMDKIKNYILDNINHRTIKNCDLTTTQCVVYTVATLLQKPREEVVSVLNQLIEDGELIEIEIKVPEGTPGHSINFSAVLPKGSEVKVVQTEKEQEAFKLGYNAYYGITEECPYEYETEKNLYNAWQDGYMSANIEDRVG